MKAEKATILTHYACNVSQRKTAQIATQCREFVACVATHTQVKKCRSANRQNLKILEKAVYHIGRLTTTQPFIAQELVFQLSLDTCSCLVQQLLRNTAFIQYKKASNRPSFSNLHKKQNWILPLQIWQSALSFRSSLSARMQKSLTWMVQMVLFVPGVAYKNILKCFLIKLAFIQLWCGVRYVFVARLNLLWSIVARTLYGIVASWMKNSLSLQLCILASSGF